MQIKIIPNETGNPAGKLADAELHFDAADGPLSGCKLIGFAVWQTRTAERRNVTFPARQYSVNGERRSFALYRPIAHAEATSTIRDLILQAYALQTGELTIEPTADERAAAQSTETTTPAADPDLDAERTRGAFDAEAVARELWRRFTPNERAGVAYGLFPAHLYSATALSNEQRHAVTVELMKFPTVGKVVETPKQQPDLRF